MQMYALCWYIEYLIHKTEQRNLWFNNHWSKTYQWSNFSTCCLVKVTMNIKFIFSSNSAPITPVFVSKSLVVDKLFFVKKSLKRQWLFYMPISVLYPIPASKFQQVCSLTFFMNIKNKYIIICMQWKHCKF